MGVKSSIAWTNSTWTPIRARVKKDAAEIARQKGYTSLIQIAQEMQGRVGPHCEKVSPGCEHLPLVVHEVERLEERLLAFKAFVPLASDLNHRTLAVDRGVNEALDLYAVPLQLRPFNSTPDTKLDGLGELGSNHHVVLIFPSIQHVIAFHSQNVWQENRITRSDSYVLDSEYQRGTRG